MAALPSKAKGCALFQMSKYMSGRAGLGCTELGIVPPTACWGGTGGKEMLMCHVAAGRSCQMLIPQELLHCHLLVFCCTTVCEKSASVILSVFRLSDQAFLCGISICILLQRTHRGKNA